MHPKLDLDLVQIDLYTALIAGAIFLGLLTAFVYLRWRTRPVFPLTVFLDGTLVTLAAAWIGAHAFHILTHWEYYQTRPQEILAWGAGGLGIRGALGLGLIGLIVFARVRRLHGARLMDAAALGLALGQAVGWMGALVEGANYGIVSDSRIAQDLPDIYGIVAPRLPVQYIEIVFFGVLFVLLTAIAVRRPRSGFIFLVYLFVSSIANGLVGFARADETAHIGAFRIDQVFDAALALGAVIGLVWFQLRKRSVSAEAAFSFNTIESSALVSEKTG